MLATLLIKCQAWAWGLGSGWNLWCAASPVLLQIHSHLRSCHLPHPVGFQYSQNLQPSFSVTLFSCHLLSQAQKPLWREKYLTGHCCCPFILPWGKGSPRSCARATRVVFNHSLGIALQYWEQINILIFQRNILPHMHYPMTNFHFIS